MMPLWTQQLRVSSKQTVLNTVLGWATTPVHIPDDLKPALVGHFGGGQAFLNYRWAQFAFLIRVVNEILATGEPNREQLLSDPSRFRALAESVLPDHDGGQRARAQLNLLLFLVFPHVFAPIANSNHKQLVCSTFRDKLGAPTGDVDRDLQAIWRTLEDETGRRVELYEEPWLSQWLPKRPRRQRGWLVRGANVDGHNAVAGWLREGFCSISFGEAPEIPAGADRDVVVAAVDEAYPDTSESAKQQHVAQLYRFLTEMQPDDLVATVVDDDVYVGKVTGAAYYDDSAGLYVARRRPVAWERPDHPLQRSKLSEEVQARLRDRHTVVDVTRVMAGLVRAAGKDEIAKPEVRDADETRPMQIPIVTEQLADELHIPLEWLQETVDLLRYKKQIILSGPPGTGKTYLAMRLAEHLAGQDRADLIQFHPSYGYEDFVEGFRPRPGPTRGVIGFELVPGPFRLAVEEADKDPTRPYMLIIDEINRAQLAKVFGELYFLLEYRNRAITLQYSPQEPFKLPKNVFLIGTMDTVDRSVALIDTALRRRFAFRPLAPDRPPIQGLLRRWLRKRNLPEAPALLLDALNARLADPDRAIGPAYLMRTDVAEPGVLERVWSTEILPLLEDQLYGEVHDVEKTYGLTALRAALDRAAEPE